MDINQLDAHWLRRRLGESYPEMQPEEIMDIE